MLNKSALKEIAHRLNGVAVHWGLGGSSMLYLQGIDIDPQDIDVFVLPQDFDDALRVLSADNSFIELGPQGIFASDRFAHGTFMGSPIDLMAGFHILSNNSDLVYHFDPSTMIMIELDEVQVPCCRLEEWIILYESMGKQSNAELIRKAIAE